MRHASHSGLPTSGSCVLLNIQWKWHTSGSLEGEAAAEGYIMKVLYVGNWRRQAPQTWKKMRPVTPEGSGTGPRKASKFLIFGALITPSVEPSHRPEHFWSKVYRDELKPGIPPQGELAVSQKALEEWIGSSHTAPDTSRLSGLPRTSDCPVCLFQRGNSIRPTQRYLSHSLSTEGSLWGTSLTSVRSLKGTWGCEMEIVRGIRLLRILGNVIQTDSKVNEVSECGDICPGWSKCWKSLDTDFIHSTRCDKS